MAKMSKAEISVKFAELSDEAQKVNSRSKDRRFYPMSHHRNSKLFEFGMYDYKTKKYTLESIHSPHAQSALNEMRSMLDRAQQNTRSTEL